MTEQQLRFFVHRDPDALRVEVAGSLSGAEMDNIYQTLQRETRGDTLMPVIVDITFITNADQSGRGLIAAFHRFGARIIADSPAADAIARPIVTKPVEKPHSRPGWFRWLRASSQPIVMQMPVFRHMPKYSGAS